MKNKKTKRRSPLHDKPLRHAGQSLDEEINRLLDDKINFDAYYLVSILGITVFGWFLYFFPQKTPPIGATVVGLLICILLLNRLRKTWKLLNQLKFGRQGEKIVAEMLEELRVHGYGVLHDVPGTRFNLDHVVFTRHGIFVIETKTVSKRSPNAHVSFDGKTILVDGRKYPRDPVVQVKAAARWLKELLQKSAGRAFPVKGVVVYPGWYVDSLPGAKKADIWVLNPKALQGFISNQPVILKDEDVQMAVFHVSRIVRGH